MRLSDLPHLVRRFFGSLRPAAASPEEQQEVAGLLSTEEAASFWAQPAPDVRHALDAVARLETTGVTRPALRRAALLHDIGKRHSGLGTIGRSVASALSILRLPVTRRMRRYLDHGEIGAQELETLDAGTLEIAFARHHHQDAPPDGVDAGEWRLLADADDE